MTAYQIMYWHDIPIQVRAGGRRDRVSRELPERFQIAIDNAAMAAGLVGSDAYIEGFHWEPGGEMEGTAEEVVTAVIAQLDTQYKPINWRATAAMLKEEQ